MDTETKIRTEDPYYSTDGYLDVAISSLAEAREKIHAAMDAMDGADGMTADGKAEAMTNMLKGLETFIRATEDQLDISAYEIREKLMEKCKARLTDEQGDARMDQIVPMEDLAEEPQTEDVDKAMDIVLTKHSYAVLRYISSHPKAARTDVFAHAMGGKSPRTIQLRVDELIERGLIEVDVGKGRWNRHALTLTPAGQLISMNLAKIREVLGMIE